MLALLLLLPMLSALGRAQEGFLCTEAFCEKQLASVTCITLPPGCNSTAGLYLKAASPCSCCDYCLPQLGAGEVCNADTPGAGTPRKICGDGLTCSALTHTCEGMNSTCIAEQQLYDSDKNQGRLGAARWRPLCDGEGDFGPLRCVPNSLCYCIEPVNGTRIFGEALYTSEDIPKEMNCGCSLAARKASRLPFDVQVAQCLADGSFDRLQCLGSNCSCVSREDASPDGNTVVDVLDLKPGSPVCFDPLEHTAGVFERACERVRQSLLDGKREAEREGFTVLLRLRLPDCTPDGRYARVQNSTDRRRICVDPEGGQIEQFGSSCRDTDCHCARTRWLIQQNGAAMETPVCCSDGTFRAWQCLRGLCYCVDSNGNQISEDVAWENLEELSCHNNTGCPLDTC